MERSSYPGLQIVGGYDWRGYGGGVKKYKVGKEERTIARMNRA